jgi:hypothetical protein
LQTHVPEEEWVQWREHRGIAWKDWLRSLEYCVGQILGDKFKWKTLQKGSATIAVAAFDPSIADKSGAYLVYADIGDKVAHATGPEPAQKLWELSVKLVGEKFEY